jgi:DNA repair exonuclease SbcCD nuclease subunit
MRFLAIGDIHIKTDNIEETDILMTEIQKICGLVKPDYIVLLGDILHHHEKILSPCLNRAFEFIKKCCAIAFTYILVGNHDYCNNSQFLSENHWMNVLKGYPKLYIVDNVVVGGNFILCPYVYPGRFIEALETKTGEWLKTGVIFAHQEFKGCKMGAIESTMGDVWLDEYPVVVSGHIHDVQRVGKVYYPGAPLQHAFGDTDKRIILSVDVMDDGKCDIKEFELNVPKKYTVKSSIKDLTKMKVPKDGDKVKIKLDTTQEEFKLFKESKTYKDMVDKGYKFQLPKVSVKIGQEKKMGNFMDILEELVREDDQLTYEVYREIIFDQLIL